MQGYGLGDGRVAHTDMATEVGGFISLKSAMYGAWSDENIMNPTWTENSKNMKT